MTVKNQIEFSLSEPSRNVNSWLFHILTNKCNKGGPSIATRNTPGVKYSLPCGPV